MDLAAWIERQLEPECIPGRAGRARLGAYPTLRVTTAELFHEFPGPIPHGEHAAPEAITICDTPTAALPPRRRCSTLPTRSHAFVMSLWRRPKGIGTRMAMRGVGNYGANQNEELRAFANTQVIF